MSKKLLYVLVLLLSVYQISFAQQAEILGNCIYNSTSNRITIRLAIRNNTNSSNTIEYVGQRWGIQYNTSAVTYAGFFSHMYLGTNQSSGLNDAGNLTNIGPDTGTGINDLGIDPAVGNTRVANITGGGTKTLTMRYINRSTDNCPNAIVLLPNQMVVLLDIYFTLNNSSLASFYNLNTPGYGFGTPDFIAQFFTKPGKHTSSLAGPKKEIAVTIIREGNSNDLYQPFDVNVNNCGSLNINPITVAGDDINFINPINGVLSGKIKSLSGSAKNGFAELNWDVENNNLVDRYEIERKDASGNFKTIALILSDNNADTKRYNYKDKLTNNEELVQYRIKAICVDGTESLSSIVKVNSKQSQSAEIRITPNPVTNFVQMQLPVINGSYTCRVYNSEGRLVLNSQVLAASSKINVDQLVKGTYFLEAYHPQTGNRYFGKFSKQ